ncbi:MAG: hypothetical protein ACKVWR_12440 [Acidimicrobiales bacterium]
MRRAARKGAAGKGAAALAAFTAAGVVVGVGLASAASGTGPPQPTSSTTALAAPAPAANAAEVVVDQQGGGHNSRTIEVVQGDQPPATPSTAAPPAQQPDAPAAAPAQEDAMTATDGPSSPQPPSPPTSLTVQVNAAGVELRWSPAGGAVDGYRVLRNGETQAELGADARRFLDADPPAGVALEYRVVAFGPGGESASRTRSTVVTGGDAASAPSAPTNRVTVTTSGPAEVRVVQSNTGGSQHNSAVVRVDN